MSSVDQDRGVPAAPSGSQASPEAAGASSPTVSIPNVNWQPISSAPQDTLPIFAETFDGFRLLVHWEAGGFMNDSEEECGSWVAHIKDVHPEDWTDGACWSSNENGSPSDPLVRWIDPSEIAANVADRCTARKGTDNYARIYQGARLGALAAFVLLASGMSADTAETQGGSGAQHRQPGPKGTPDTDSSSHTGAE